MKSQYFKRVVQVILIVLVISMVYYVFTPYKVIRQLPKISLDEVESINLWLANNGDMDISDDLNDLVSWYNNAKELREEVGTTPDSRIDINLKDNTQIKIWNLYSDEWVTIGYEKDSVYYQTNVYSPKIAKYFIDFRDKHKN